MRKFAYVRIRYAINLTYATPSFVAYTHDISLLPTSEQYYQARTQDFSPEIQ